MGPEDNHLREKVGRRLTKKRKDQPRMSLDIPERLRDGDDAQDDVTAPKSRDTFNMNQSLFSMIAKAGSQADLHGRIIEEHSSESEGEGGPTTKRVAQSAYEGATTRTSRQTQPALGHHRKSSEHRLLRSIPRLALRSRKEGRSSTSADTGEPMSSSQILPPRPSIDDTDHNPTLPVPTSKGKSKEKAERGSELSSRAAEQDATQSAMTSSKLGSNSASLAQRLRSIFQFEELEEVICEYPCWLVQSVLLQGYMYITQKHICFYAYIAKKSTDGGSKTGFLSKKGNRKYNRYWFMLKGDVLSYYTDPSDLYFPRNRINLSRAISASVLEHKEGKDKEATEFVIESEKRTFKFIADSAASALEWVRAVQKVIFRTHNEGNSVKISLPIDNVLDVEENPLLDFAETIKIRVIDNDETYAVDEYYFSFFHSGRDALNVLKIMVDDNGLADVRSGNESPVAETVPRKSRSYDRPQHPHRVTSDPSDPAVPVIRENVRATLSPLPPTGMRSSSPRVSMDSRRSSYDVKRRSMDIVRSFSRANSDSGRRSFSVNRSLSRGASQNRKDKTAHSPRAMDSDASASHSFDPETESSAAIQSIDDTNASASQILNRSDVFHRPTIQHSQSGLSDSDLDQLHHSQVTTRSFHAEKPLSSPTGYLRKTPAEPHLTTELDEEQENRQSNIQGSGSSSALQNLYQAGSYPIQKASGIAGLIKKSSTKMSRLLATESMGYYEKVSGMWAGGRKHYNPPEGLTPDDHVRGVDDDDDTNVDSERFREHFALPASEELQATFFGSLQRLLPQYGKIYISDRHFCFRTLMPTTRTKLILPLRDIENVEKEKGFRFGYHGLVITIRGHEELFFEFNKQDLRDDCAVTLLRRLESLRFMEDSTVLHKQEQLREELARAEHDLLQEARQEAPPETVPQPLANDFDAGRGALIFDDPYASIVDFKPTASLNITCLTIGSRGDVQPYIALCKGLIAEGHKAKIATHAEFEKAVREQGIDFAPVAGDPAELMRICVENGMFTLSFMREASDKFRGWLDGLMETAWEACQGSDILIESPSAMIGIHIAEALRIPYFRAFGMPWTRTRTYPHAFGVPDHKLGGHYNQATYVVFDAVFWRAIAGQVNGFRKRALGISSTNQAKMQANARPFLYNFSPSVVVPPLDWPDWIRVTGYWFLDGASTYTPPADLVAFIEKARQDQKKIVYVGFGSIVVDDPAALTKTVVDSVLKADVRCILSKGWSERLGKKDASKPEVPLPPEIFQIKEAPHDWLFLQVDAAVHHGGCGTTGASLRAGIPTVIKPFFGDQFFFGIRVEDLGVGICIKKINTSVLARAMWTATNDERMIVKAKVLGEKIRKENGVQLAIQTIYRELERAKTFVKTAKDGAADDSDDEWTFVEDDAEAEMEVMGHLAHFGQPTSQASMVHSQGQGGSSSMALGSMVMRGMGGARGGARG